MSQAPVRNVKSRVTTTPPGSPGFNDSYFIPSGASGGWSGKDNHFADFVFGGWAYRAASKGDAFHDETDSTYWYWTGAALTQFNQPPTSFATTTAFSGDLTPSQITGDVNDYNPTNLSTATVLRIDSDANRIISGLAGGADGRMIVILNIGAAYFTLAKENSGSSAANRFDFKADYVIGPKESVILWYDSTSSRWRLAAHSERPALSPITVTYSGTGTTGANSEATGFQTSASTTCRLKVPTGYTLYVIAASGAIESGTTNGDYTLSVCIREHTTPLTTDLASQVVTVAGGVAQIATPSAFGSLASPLATISAGKNFSVGWHNVNGVSGALSASQKFIAVTFVLVPT